MVIVAIDGPSGVGKTTTSKLVARQLGIPHIDTGAMYRAVGLKALRMGIDPSNTNEAVKLAAESSIEFRWDVGVPRVILDGEDVSEEIRAPEVSMVASTISAVSGVRRVLVELQQKMGRERGGVLEGRDIGTKVFPETPHKFFLTADGHIRAARRYRELLDRGDDSAQLDEVRQDIDRRDRQDSDRDDSPLTCDATYTLVDTTNMTIEEVVSKIVAQVRSVTSP